MIMSDCRYRVIMARKTSPHTALLFDKPVLLSYPILSYPFLCLIPCDVIFSGPEAAASSEPREVHGGGDEGLGAEAADRQGCPDTGGEGEERHRQVTRIKEEKRREEEEEKRREERRKRRGGREEKRRGEEEEEKRRGGREEKRGEEEEKRRRGGREEKRREERRKRRKRRGGREEKRRGGREEKRRKRREEKRREEKRRKILPSPAALLYSLFCDC
jgi:hypothetical protein